VLYICNYCDRNLNSLFDGFKFCNTVCRDKHRASWRNRLDKRKLLKGVELGINVENSNFKIIKCCTCNLLFCRSINDIRGKYCSETCRERMRIYNAKRSRKYYIQNNLPIPEKLKQ